jgi:hypothetical protein
MRLTEFQRVTIKAAVFNVIDTDSRIWLLGSCADDTKRDGDIDLLIETENVLPNCVGALCRMEGRLVTELWVTVNRHPSQGRTPPRGIDTIRQLMKPPEASSRPIGFTTDIRNKKIS